MRTTTPKTARYTESPSHVDAAAGFQGITQVPPAYGIAMVDGALREAVPERDQAHTEPARSGTIQMQAAASVAGSAAGERPANRTGLPDPLKAGIEHTSGLAMDDVRVYYNSPRPVQLQALAYTQGAAIHIGPGQERHLPHEAWHVVQQKQGRVPPTQQVNGVAMNTNAQLEHEANVMGQRSLERTQAASMPPAQPVMPTTRSAPGIIQRMMVCMPNPYEGGTLGAVGDAEVDEMGELLESKGCDGDGGHYFWEAEGRDGNWKVARREVNYFYGHGNRETFGGLTASEFVDEIVKPRRQLHRDSALKLVACGGGRLAAEHPDLEAYGKQVSTLLQQKDLYQPFLQQKQQWTGALKATEGFLYATNEYNMIIPEHPAAIETYQKKEADKVDNAIRTSLWKIIVAGLQTKNDPEQRKKDFEAFQNAATAYLTKYQVPVQAYTVNPVFTNARLARLPAELDGVFKGVSLMNIIATLQKLLKKGILSSNLVAKAGLQQGIEDALDTMETAGQTIWKTYKGELFNTQMASDPSVVKERKPGQKAAIGIDANRRFSAYQSFGPTPWAEAKHSIKTGIAITR